MDDTIRNIALIGTDRSPLHKVTLPEPIRARLSDHTTDEALILEAISYACFSHEFGHPLATSEVIIDESIVEEKLPYARKEISELLMDILSVAISIRQSLLKSWLEMMQKRSELVLPESVIPLIQAGNTQPEDIRAMIITVIGNRGKKILPFLPDEKYTTSILSGSVWLEGTAEQRRQHFLHIRQNDQQKGLDLIRENWNTENVRDKASFLRIIADTLAPIDLQFLEDLYTSVYAGKAFQKTTERECKLWICHMLLRLKYNPLLESIRQGLSPYVIPKQSKSILDRVLGRKMNELKLPDTHDQFWNGKNMNELIGLDEKNTDLLHFDHDPLFWLNGMIEIIPFHFWTELLQCDYKQAADYFLNNDHFQTTVKGNRIPIFQNALLGICILTRDQDLIGQLIEMIPEEMVIPIIPFMKQSVFEKYMDDHLSAGMFEILNKRNEHDDHQWSEAFTRKVINQFSQDLNNGKLHIHSHHGLTIARFGHRKVLDILHEVVQDQTNASWQAQWQTLIVEPVDKINSIKFSIDQFMNNSRL